MSVTVLEGKLTQLANNTTCDNVGLNQRGPRGHTWLFDLPHVSVSVRVGLPKYPKFGFVKPGPALCFHIKGPTFLFACGSTLFHTSSNVQNYIFKLSLSSETSRSTLSAIMLDCCYVGSDQVKMLSSTPTAGAASPLVIPLFNVSQTDYVAKPVLVLVRTLKSLKAFWLAGWQPGAERAASVDMTWLSLSTNDEWNVHTQ